MSRLMARAGAVTALISVGLLWRWSEMLFSAHMVQHLLLIVVAAPLLVLGGISIRMAPVVGWSLFVVVFLFWHWPAAFQWAALYPWASLLESGSILAAAVGFWSGILGPHCFNDGARALMVMAAAVLTDLPGVVMLFAPRVICTMPYENAGWFGLSPLEDQQVAGLLMWVPANLVFFSVATFLFARWIGALRRPA